MTRTSLLVFLVTAACGCGAVDGTDPYALWKTYEHPLGAFHFHYPSPPWKEADGSTDTDLVLVVDPGPTSDAGEPGARYRLEAAVVAGDVAEDASVAEQSRLEARGYGTSPPRGWENGAGDHGVIIEGRNDGASVAAVLLATSYGVAALRIFTRDDIDDPDVDLLLESLEPRAAGEN
ncbi:MAG: hypothetical protein PHU25_14680 [Deltaproteobacteria bacterium]|nr:hypothetical protein [Deltaproteobacteria bacterium]